MRRFLTYLVVGLGEDAPAAAVMAHKKAARQIAMRAQSSLLVTSPSR